MKQESPRPSRARLNRLTAGSRSEFAARRVADIYVTDDGVMVYVFPGFPPDTEKRTAHRL